jgi:hypothetical protein
MKSYNTLYYLLTMLLVMGALASMAQNSYGMLIISGVCIAFGLIFFIQFIQRAGEKNSMHKRQALEFLVLFLLSVVIALKTFQIYIPVVEWIFSLSGLVLAGIYLSALIRHVRDYSVKSKTLAWLIGVAYAGIILFCLAMILINLSAQGSWYAGALALLAVAAFVIIALTKKEFLIDGEKIRVFNLIAGFRDRFYLLVSLFVLFSLYLGLTTSGILPRLYSSNYPQAYYELVNQAETGQEKRVDGKYRYEEFKTMYDRFVEQNIREVNK